MYVGDINFIKQNLRFQRHGSKNVNAPKHGYMNIYIIQKNMYIYIHMYIYINMYVCVYPMRQRTSVVTAPGKRGMAGAAAELPGEDVSVGSMASDVL